MSKNIEIRRIMEKLSKGITEAELVAEAAREGYTFMSEFFDGEQADFRQKFTPDFVSAQAREWSRLVDEHQLISTGHTDPLTGIDFGCSVCHDDGEAFPVQSLGLCGVLKACAAIYAPELV